MSHQIYRNLPEAYNKNQNYIKRRTETYNSPPLTSQRVKSEFYSIKSDLDIYQMMTVNKKIVQEIPYFSYKNKVYSFKDLEWKVLYVTETEDLLDLELNNKKNKKNNIPFKSVKDPGSPGTSGLKMEDLLSYHQKILKIFLYYFILKLNSEVKKSGYSKEYHPWTHYFVADYQIIRIKYHQTLNLYNYTLMIEAHRDNKHYGFVFYLEMFFRPEKVQIWISKSHLIGIQTQDALAFKHLDFYQKSDQLVGTGIDSDKDMILLGELYDKLKGKSYQINNSLDGKSYQAFLRDFDQVGKHKCFRPDNQQWIDSKNANDCLSYNPIIKKVGVWDKECEKDEDCPFFKKNKNFPNSMGECRYGKCQLPVGMKPIGYKHYTKDKPICYNCHKKIKVMTSDGQTIIKERDCSGIECNKCCDLQMDPELYPNLKSPDYAFPGDLNERIKNEKILKQQNLGIQTLLSDQPIILNT